MADGVQLVRHDPQVRTVILKSNAPGIFCAGADLKERKQMTEKEVHTLTPATKSCQLKKGNIPILCDNDAQRDYWAVCVCF